MSAASCPEVAALVGLIGAEFERCKADGVDRDTATTRTTAAGQAEIDRLWPGRYEVDVQIDDLWRLAYMVSRTDRPRYRKVHFDESTQTFLEVE